MSGTVLLGLLLIAVSLAVSAGAALSLHRQWRREH